MQFDADVNLVAFGIINSITRIDRTPLVVYCTENLGGKGCIIIDEEGCRMHDMQ